MKEICLDRTISLTTKVMNNEEKLPNAIIPIKEFGGMSRFRFAGSQKEIPIEHVGLAMLCYQKAVSQYTMKEITPEGEDVHFESLVNSGSNIADFLETISPDALNWYSAGARELKLSYVGSRVIPSSQKHTGVCKSLSEEGEDLRVVSVSEAYSEALRDYMDIESASMREQPSQETTSQVEDFIKADVEKFNTGLEELVQESATLLKGEQPKQGLEGSPNAFSGFGDYDQLFS